MLLGLDAIPLTERWTGVGHYTFELARALCVAAPGAELALTYPSTFPALQLDDEGAAGRASPPSNLRTVRVPVGALGRHWWSVGLPLHVRRARLALFHGTNYDVPLWGGAPTVLTVHDLSLLLHPETHEARRVARARRRLPLMLRRATCVITPTEAVRRELCEHLAVDAGKVFAVHEAPRACFRPAGAEATRAVRRRHRIGTDFLLTVGTIEPRKNLAALVRAFAEVCRAQTVDGLQLVVAGARGWLNGALEAELERSPVRERILFTGYLSDAELRALYSACRLFVYPSLYEGFGLPPLEAMACGAPVVAARIPAIMEVAGAAARLFDALDEAGLARAIVELLADERERAQRSEAGRERAAEFTWERAARLTLDVYAEALRRGRAGRSGEAARLLRASRR